MSAISKKRNRQVVPGRARLEKLSKARLIRLIIEKRQAARLRLEDREKRIAEPTLVMTCQLGNISFHRLLKASLVNYIRKSNNRRSVGARSGAAMMFQAAAVDDRVVVLCRPLGHRGISREAAAITCHMCDSQLRRLVWIVGLIDSILECE